MNTFRTGRPLLVNSTQYTQTSSIVIDLGERDIHASDWGQLDLLSSWTYCPI